MMENREFVGWVLNVGILLAIFGWVLVGINDFMNWYYRRKE